VLSDEGFRPLREVVEGTPAGRRARNWTVLN
jgi:hypothetical protein